VAKRFEKHNRERHI